MNPKANVGRSFAIAAAAVIALGVGAPSIASAAPGDNGHHHCGGNSGQGQGNHCDDDSTPPGDQGDNTGDDQGTGSGDQDNNGGDQGDGTDQGDNQGGDDQNQGGDNSNPGDDQTPPGDQDQGGDQGTGGDQGDNTGDDGSDSQPPAGDTTTINIGVGINVPVVVAPNVTIHFGDNVTVNNYTIYQVNNVTTNNIVVNNQQYKEVTVYSVDTNVYYLGYYDANGEFHCTGYYHDNVKTPEQANVALANHDVVKKVPDVEVVTGVNPVADSSFLQDNLMWEVPLGIALVAVAGYGLVTVIRRRNNDGNGPTSLPGASA